MPRLNNNTELFKRITGVEMFLLQTGTIFDQVTAGSTAKGASTITVPASTNATNGDPLFIIGANFVEINQISGTVALAMPIKYKTAALHPAGTRVVEARSLPLGRIEVNGFTITPSQSETTIEAADVDTPVQTIKGALEISYSFGLLGFNAQNLLNAFGYDDNETGAGTAGDPYQATIGDASATALSIVGFRVTGIRYDGQTILADLTNCSVTPTGAIQLGAKNSATAIGFQGKASYITYRQYT